MNDLSDQSVMVFDDATARTTAIPTPVEGMVTYLSDEDEVQVFDGSAFKAVGPGKILQVVSATDTTNRATNSATFQDAGLSVSITPSAASSVLIIEWTCNVRVERTSSSTIIRSGDVRVLDGASSLGTAEVGRRLIGANNARAESLDFVSYRSVLTAGSTSERTFAVEFNVGSTGATITLQNASLNGVITVTEVIA